ncbi:MAG: alpha-L-fucosidase [Cytophagales bacterium]|jgi:alpha-L-fucosidase|nr:alpha-L-fucosidase [Cytophagales bacterium]MCA6388943.1 alpha-L-fucosidase [Cytophagales bacterium]MCA6391361.1 alpha-L-fucosidase [Cytophagales bacterium]MCA6395280.1 alpha-L-fucosidase [Cytophagales bacterium]MCA6398424.1 alpha-L-fucosidase [Cytophagales bacterium]
MKYLRVLFVAIICLFIQANVLAQTAQEQPKRPVNFQPFRYKYTIEELRDKFSAEMMKKAAEEVKKIEEVNGKGAYKPTVESLAKHAIPEWFQDAKLGIFLDWGPWSSAGYAPKKGAEASTGGSYPDWYEFLMDYRYKGYHDKTFGTDFRRDDLLPMLTGANLNADEYMNLAVEAGAKYYVPFSKHHAGWTMWESSYTKRNAVEMGPKRDIYKELAAAAKARGMKLGFYFSVSEWEYPVIVDRPLSQWDPTKDLAIFQDQLGQIPRATPLVSYFPEIYDRMVSGKIPVRNYFSDYMMPSFKEAVDKFDPDLVWYDGGWGSPVSVSRAAELSAYFYNQATGRKDVVINNRAGTTLSEAELAQVGELMKKGEMEKAMKIYLSSTQLGDYGTPEFTIGEVDITKKWEVCRSISPAFGYNWQDDDQSSLSSADLVKMFVKIVAENGNLLLVVSPDGSGKLPEVQRSRLVELGAWLKMNGEGIYGTRPWSSTKDGDTYFTKSKEGKYVYVHSTVWPGKTLSIKNIAPIAGTKVTMLGAKSSLKWTQTGKDVQISIPDNLQTESNRPGKYAWVFKVQVKK